MQQNNAVVTIGGTRFRIEKLSDTYTIARPVDDPHWMNRALYIHVAEQAYKAVEMKLTEEQLELLIASRTQFDTIMLIQRSLEAEKQELLETTYQKLKHSIPGMSKEDLRGFLELGEILLDEGLSRNHEKA